MKRCALILLLATSTAAFAQSQNFQMPGGAGCAGAIARYQAVQQNDYTSGNVAAAVHAQIEREIAAAEKVCSAGEDAKATGMIRASESRHGYSTRI